MNDKAKSSGLKNVQAIIADAQNNLSRRKVIKDPPVGEAMLIDGKPVKPGEWLADVNGMPPNCPVQVLGMGGDILYVIDVIGQIAACDPGKMGQNFIQRLFGDRQRYLYWAFPRFSQKGSIDAWRTEKVREVLYTAGAKCNIFSSVDQVRGRGAWPDVKSGLIYHAGESIWSTNARDRKGNLRDLNVGYHDDFLYTRRPSIAEPWPEKIEVEDNPSRDIILALRQWNWERPHIDPILVFGWIVSAMIGGALDWRPVIFLVGDAATGKSTLQKMLKAILGKSLIQSADTTQAGIYQRVKQDSLPVALDEIEAREDNRKAMAVIELARLASSGALMFRGGADHTATEFRACNSFLFSAINAPPLQPQDVSRMALIQLNTLDMSKSAEKPPSLNADTCGRMLLRRVMDEWYRFPAALEAYRSVLRENGNSGRQQDTLGTLLACADIALGPELAEELGINMVDDLSSWGVYLKASQDKDENWRKCISHLLTSQVDAWRGGKRSTVGALLDELKFNHAEGYAAGDGCLNFKDANRELSQADLRVLAPGEVCSAELGFVLAVPHESQMIMKLFQGSVWAGTPSASVWPGALAQAPKKTVIRNPEINKLRINGKQRRCSLVVLSELEE